MSLHMAVYQCPVSTTEFRIWGLDKDTSPKVHVHTRQAGRNSCNVKLDFASVGSWILLCSNFNFLLILVEWKFFILLIFFYLFRVLDFIVQIKFFIHKKKK